MSNALYHQRGGNIDPLYLKNEKWMNANMYTEFIIDVNGEFVTMWDVVKTDENGELFIEINDTRFDLNIFVGINKTEDDYNNVKARVVEKVGKAEYENAMFKIANTESINYSGKYAPAFWDDTMENHNEIDVGLGKYDPPIRRGVNQYDPDFGVPNWIENAIKRGLI